jgi:hypothetical protein
MHEMANLFSTLKTCELTLIVDVYKAEGEYRRCWRNDDSDRADFRQTQGASQGGQGRGQGGASTLSHLIGHLQRQGRVWVRAKAR